MRVQLRAMDVKGQPAPTNPIPETPDASRDTDTPQTPLDERVLEVADIWDAKYRKIRESLDPAIDRKQPLVDEGKMLLEGINRDLMETHRQMVEAARTHGRESEQCKSIQEQRDSLFKKKEMVESNLKPLQWALNDLIDDRRAAIYGMEQRMAEAYPEEMALLMPEIEIFKREYDEKKESL